eukprot:CAMPEP_0172492704 /NCGR_PEP_ID=MMETSP1066-20121228/23931_1 /TAXON_ID=671091 /ORGANISM="Coscinodiscus wailesii, Strain CCMP2513" /LENGTH=807 /DNA_ID=CAMNT_0013262483 /DNA_START=45 /DNA_END=2468 /DNA_ORIENTATION=+
MEFTSSLSSSHPTELFDLISCRKYEEAIERVKYHPDEASTLLLVKNRGDPGIIVTRQLPLHVACLAIEPNKPQQVVNSVIIRLLEAYPDACFQKDNDNRLPIHIACQQRASLNIIARMLRIYPNSTQALNDVQEFLPCNKSNILESLKRAKITRKGNSTKDTNVTTGKEEMEVYQQVQPVKLPQENNEEKIGISDKLVRIDCVVEPTTEDEKIPESIKEEGKKIPTRMAKRPQKSSFHLRQSANVHMDFLSAVQELSQNVKTYNDRAEGNTIKVSDVRQVEASLEINAERKNMNEGILLNDNIVENPSRDKPLSIIKEESRPSSVVKKPQRSSFHLRQSANVNVDFLSAVHKLLQEDKKSATIGLMGNRSQEEQQVQSPGEMDNERTTINNEILYNGSNLEKSSQKEVLCKIKEEKINKSGTSTVKRPQRSSFHLRRSVHRNTVKRPQINEINMSTRIHSQETIPSKSSHEITGDIADTSLLHKQSSKIKVETGDVNSALQVEQPAKIRLKFLNAVHKLQQRTHNEQRKNDHEAMIVLEEKLSKMNEKYHKIHTHNAFLQKENDTLCTNHKKLQNDYKELRESHQKLQVSHNELMSKLSSDCTNEKSSLSIGSANANRDNNPFNHNRPPSNYGNKCDSLQQSPIDETAKVNKQYCKSQIEIAILKKHNNYLQRNHEELHAEHQILRESHQHLFASNRNLMALHRDSDQYFSEEENIVYISTLESQISALMRVIGSYSMQMKYIQDGVMNPIKHYRYGIMKVLNDNVMNELKGVLRGDIMVEKSVQMFITSMILEQMGQSIDDYWCHE